MAVHPANAVFVSGDGKVSFNEQGRKLDSLGNVVWGDRQSLRGARARVRPEIEEAYRQMDQQAQQPAQQKLPAMPTYQPPAVAAQPPMQQPATNPWRNVTQWQTPAGPQASQAPAWEPPPSGLGAPQQNWNTFQPPQQQAPAWEPPPSGLGAPQQNWNTFQPPQQQAPAWEPPPSGLGAPQQFRYDPLASAPGNWNRFRR